MTEPREKVQLTKSGLLKDITVDGLSRAEMAKKYGLPVSQLLAAVKQAGLKDKKAKRVLFELTDDTIEE